MGGRLTFSVLVVLGAILGHTTYAQHLKPAYNIHQFDNRYGLSNSAVNCLLHDADGMLWIGTWDGLNRYDGKDFHVFNYQIKARSQGLISNIVQGLAQDRQRRIWISTVEGISSYDKSSGRFKHYFYQPVAKGIREDEFEVAVDTAGVVYARTPQHGLARYDAGRDTFLACTLPSASVPLTKIQIDSSNRLWTLTQTGEAFVYELASTDTFRLVYQFPVKQYPITGLHEANGAIFLSDRLGNLYRITPGMLNYQHIASLGHSVGTMVWYDDRYYIALATQGILALDASFAPQPLDAGIGVLRAMNVRDWAVGKDQLLWVATDGNGFVRVSPRNNPFYTISPESMASRAPVRAILEVDGDLWVGTKGGGIAILRDFVPQRSHQDNWRQVSTTNNLVNNDVFAIVGSQTKGLVYIGTDGRGMAVYDRRRQKLYNWDALEGHENFPEFGSVYAIVEDHDGTLWVGTSGYGLLHLRVDETAAGRMHVTFIRQYQNVPQGEGLANDIVYSLCLGLDNQLWVACRYGGLSLLDKATGHITNFKAFTYVGSLSNNDVLSLYRDQRDRLWVGTSFGLNWISLHDVNDSVPAFQRITAADGLPNNTIHAITSDEEGHIWISTNKGLARIQPESGLVVQFQQNDGLQSAEFSDGAVWKDPLGFLYFGGIYGLNYFQPQQIPNDTDLPNLVIQRLQLGGWRMGDAEYQVLQPNGGTPPLFTLSRNQNYFSAEIHALSHLQADKCAYAWLLEGHDIEWQYHGADGKISYSNVPPGSYRLLVKWSNGSGVWTAATPMLDVHISPYWWLTWPALLTAAFVLVSIGYWLYNNHKNRLEIQHRLQLELSLREKDEALHENQLNFFTNIAHELQTPLTLVMGVAEQLENAPSVSQPAKRQALIAMLRQQASRLTYLVQQLLEFRKAEAGHLQTDYRQLDVTALLTNLCQLFEPMSEQQHITYEYHVPDGLQLATDSDKLEKITFNLLSNAFKHAGSHEHIVFSASLNKSLRILQLQVSNSGCQLAPGEALRIFEKFQTGKTHNAGHYSTGIGLAFTKELVSLLAGEIKATIAEGWITFRVALPIPAANDHQAADEPSRYLPSIYAEMATPAAPSLLNAADYNKVALLEKLTEAHKRTVLVVEDEQDIRYLIREVLKPYYIIYEATDGMEAIGVIRNHPPDLIISDVMMPGMDGLSLCQKVKNAPSTCHIPFVILSAKGALEQRNEGYEVGADAYIAKPFHGSHLLIRIKNLFEQQHRLHQRLRHADSVENLVHTGNPEQDDFLEALVAQIMKHLENPALNAGILEEALSMSKMQLYRKLKTISGMTPSEFIRHVRLKQATHLLATTELTVTEIFYQIGFNNQSYFFREFKKHYGCSPNEYRSRLQINS
ncbi:response regulator [Parapedobacter sp. ISTM3]|uniref:hybrid sensor histidine kinase/response regulator transcription factor n=1 Tax=Parapedobacter sp. ISTM3 TaxID=2800130 RepID=UPI00190575DC|nr:two-component regulator propeller domain-containing protein [Parapedobacter sp. ISTM3]MBK1442192.1 response regulator [Parapedobacter sp. ISTM3]